MSRSARSLAWALRRRTIGSHTRHCAILRVGHHRTDQRGRRADSDRRGVEVAVDTNTWHFITANGTRNAGTVPRYSPPVSSQPLADPGLVLGRRRRRRPICIIFDVMSKPFACCDIGRCYSETELKLASSWIIKLGFKNELVTRGCGDISGVIGPLLEGAEVGDEWGLQTTSRRYCTSRFRKRGSWHSRYS